MVMCGHWGLIWHPVNAILMCMWHKLVRHGAGIRAAGSGSKDFYRITHRSDGLLSAGHDLKEEAGNYPLNYQFLVFFRLFDFPP
jgi:hypothetical protein